MKYSENFLFRLMTATAFCVLTCCVPGFAQQAGSSADAGASANASDSVRGNSSQQEGHASSGANAQAGKHSASGSVNGDATASRSQMPAELVTKLDSKTAKVGDAVEAKTTKTVKTAQGVVIPKGSKLLGTVTQAQAHAKGQSQSMLALNFDRVQLRNGQEMMLRSTIDSISSFNALNASDSMDDMAGAGPVSGSGAARGGLGGGLVGGGGGLGGGGLVSGAGSTVGQAGGGLSRVTQNMGSQVGGTAHGVAQGVGGAANQVNGSVTGAAQEGSSLTAHATGLPGVMLSNSASGAGSGTLSAVGRNVHLDSGTRMVLNVVAQR